MGYSDNLQSKQASYTMHAISDIKYVPLFENVNESFHMGTSIP